MLALMGEADSSIEDFLNLVSGTDAIYYCLDNSEDWLPITSGTLGTDYTLTCPTSGDLAGYTVLTVVPEPTAGALLTLAGVVGLRRRRR